MPRSRPPYLHRETSRHGKGVWYVRIDKGKRIRLRAEFGTPAFTAAYNAAVIGKLAEPAVIRYKSVGWAIQRYRESAAWVKLSRATRRQRESILRSIAESAGRQPITRVDKTAVENGITRRLDRPHAARHFLQTMRGLFQWAVKAKHVHNDPTAGLKTIRPRTDGHPPWPQEWCDRFEAKWPLGTRERVAYDVMRYTGLRLGDATRLGLPHVKNGVAVIRTEKNGEIVTIPILPPLKASLDAGPIGELTYIASARGKPLTKDLAATGLGKRVERPACPVRHTGCAKQRQRSRPTMARPKPNLKHCLDGGAAIWRRLHTQRQSRPARPRRRQQTTDRTGCEHLFPHLLPRCGREAKKR